MYQDARLNGLPVTAQWLGTGPGLQINNNGGALADLPVVAIGGGARGTNVHLTPADLVAATGAEIVEISTSGA